MSKPIITTRIDHQDTVHTHITVFNRGANAGTLIVNTSDADEIIDRLMTNLEWVCAECNYYTEWPEALSS